VGALILCEEVVKGLVLSRPHFFRDRLVPFVCVRKLRIHIEDDAAEREVAVTDDLADLVFRRKGGNSIVADVPVNRTIQHIRRIGGRLALAAASPGQPSQQATSTGHLRLLW
jgi:DNA-binding PucR family transcriptional regulator